LASYSAVATDAMVVTEGEPVTQIGLDILKNGGNAIDAAIAVSFAISAYRPQSTGIGGGGFFFVYLKEQDRVFFLDARERAPAKTKLSQYLKDGVHDSNLSRYGARAVAIPGLVAGLNELYQKHRSGNYSWAELIQPAEKLAKDGFPVYWHLQNTISHLSANVDLKQYPDTANLLTNTDGTLKKNGDIFHNQHLASTFKQLAKKGSEEFYQGEIAKQIVAAIQKRGGVLELNDLKNYKPLYRTPVENTFKNYTFYGAPIPSSGGVVLLQMLKILEKFELDILDEPQRVELITKAMRIAFRDRQHYLGDSDNSTAMVATLTSDRHIQSLVNELADSFEPIESSELPATGNTTHFCIIDSAGNIVSSTQSINYYFGSALLAGDTGIFLNNTMDDFAYNAESQNIFKLQGGIPNLVAANKTPLSSMSPTLIFKNDKFFLTLGSPGGPTIISSVFHVLFNVTQSKMSLEDAVFAPRLHHQWLPDEVRVEKNGFSSSVLSHLRDKHFAVREIEDGLGNVSAIQRDLKDNKLHGVADPRREGSAAGLSLR